MSVSRLVILETILPDVAKTGVVRERWIWSLGLVDMNYYIYKINNKVSLYNTGNNIKHPVINHNRK